MSIPVSSEVKKEKAIDGDGTVWKFIHARTQDNARQAFFELLETKPPLTPTTPTTPIPPVVEEEEVISRPGFDLLMLLRVLKN